MGYYAFYDGPTAYMNIVDRLYLCRARMGAVVSSNVLLYWHWFDGYKSIADAGFATQNDANDASLGNKIGRGI